MEKIMHWHHLVVSGADVAAGLLADIEAKFVASFRAAGGPRTMALFRKTAESGGCELYFTPECGVHAWPLLEQCGATPCAGPSLAGLELLVGHNEITYYLTT